MQNISSRLDRLDKTGASDLVVKCSRKENYEDLCW